MMVSLSMRLVSLLMTCENLIHSEVMIRVPNDYNYCNFNWCFHHFYASQILFLSSHNEQYRIYFSGCFATYNSPSHFHSHSPVSTAIWGQFVKLEDSAETSGSFTLVDGVFPHSRSAP